MRRKSSYILLVAALFLLNNLLRAQPDSFRVIKGLPTKEVYDLMFDSKGLLWIGHDLGLSSYDGRTVTHYSNTSQASKAITGITEDKQGRIWCFNFNGQIFWVKNGIMHLLKEFDASKERVYPRIAICKNELIATSDRGFFVYNLETNTSKYVSIGGAIRSLAIVGDYAYAMTPSHVCSYSAEKGITKVPIEEVIPNGKELRLMIQPQVQGDTIFTITNPKSLCHRFVAKDGKLRLIDILDVGSFINDVTCNGKESWLHTKTKSILLGGKAEITGYNLTDIVTDREGSYWYSSLKYGVMVQSRSRFTKARLALPLQKNDYVRCVIVKHDKVFYGTQMGSVLMQEITDGKTTSVFTGRNVGSIEFMFPYDSTHITICPSNGFFLLNTSTYSIKSLFTRVPIKEVSVTEDYTLLSGAFAILLPNLLKPTDINWETKAIARYPLLKSMVDTSPTHNPVLINWSGPILYWTSERCRAAVFVPFNNSIIASLRSGVTEVEPHKKPVELVYKGKRVQASKLLVYKDKIFIAGVVGNVLVYDKNGLHELSVNGWINEASVLRLFLAEDRLYILTADGLCILDAATEKIIGYSEMQSMDPGNILDIKQIDGKVALISNNGIYNLSLAIPNPAIDPIISLSYAIVNGKDTLQTQNGILSHAQSNLRFYLSAPWFSNSNAVYIAYRLLGSSDTSWQYISQTDQPVYYASLPSGDYRFEAKAVHRLTNKESAIEYYQFTILKPWWQQLIFQIFILLSFVLLVTYVIRRYYLVRLQRQKNFYERELAVEKERERISADIHDELGGTLSGIKLMTEMTERKYLSKVNVKLELNEIHSSITDLSKKMREVIWSLSNENNALDNLLDYLLRRGREMFVNSDIAFHAELPENIPVVQLKGDKRRHIYLAVKEALHNALKHAEASEVYMLFIVAKTMLYIEVRDDGKGFGESTMQHVNGLRNMKIRMQQIGGDILISENNGVVIIFSVPIP